MDPNLGEWLNLVVRWTHVITGIAWIGSSFYFNWQDSHLHPPEVARKGIEGELWMVHGGSFYRAEKFGVAPTTMPKTLHWFVWEATYTWITGVLLLFLVYYLGAKIYMVDPGVSDVGPGAAVAIGIGVIAVGWFVYDVLWRSPIRRTPVLGAAIMFVLTAAAAYGLSQVLSARAAYTHVGAMLGTIMVANVWVHIIPSQRQIVAATKGGTEPDVARARAASLRSLHNNYMTLPVVFIMISGHYPATYGHAQSWLILAAVSLIGMAVRHTFNLRNKGRAALGYCFSGAAVAGMIALVYASAPRFESDTVDANEPVAFATVKAVIDLRCVPCHSVKPRHEDFDKPPEGVMFDTPQQIKTRAQRIFARTVVSQTMPLGDETSMSQEERDLLGVWVRQGAPLE
jgi:uncharacterized membrane protein